MSETEFVSKVLEAFSKIKGEIDEKGGEFDFRYALVDYLFRDVLGWSRKEGEGHFKIERERKDILFYDDSDPPLPVLIVETVNPKEESASHISKLEGYLLEMGRVRYGILTNGHDFSVYEYERDKKGERVNKKLELDIDEIVHKGAANLTEEEKSGIFQLERLFVKDRFVSFNDVEYFKKYRNDIPLNYKRGYDFFIEGLRKSLGELNEVFARICEDKGFMQKRISGKFIANFIEMHKGLKMPYLKALEDAFDFAEEEYERIFNHFDFKTVDSDILGHVYEDYLPKEERKKLGEYYTPLEVVQYIFACHIAEMNLFFQTIDLYGAVKSKYKEEVFKGFNVFHTDSLMPPGSKLEDYSDVRVKPFLNNIKDIARIKGMKFDFVVGNPPYVRVQRLGKEQKEQYGKYYQTPKANYDIYIIFIERGAKWLEKNGKLGYITSDQYTLTNYGEKLRKFIAENYKIEQFIDFADTGVFRDVTNYPSIIVITKTDSEKEIKSNFVKCARVKQPKDDLLKDIQRRFYKREYFNEYYGLFEFPQEDLSDIWSFMPQKEEKVFKKIEDNADCKFKEISERIFQGLVSGADAVYLVKVTEEINDNLVKIKPIKSEREYVIEKGMLKPLLKGEDVRRWNIDWKGLWVIFPYKIVSDDAILYSEDEVIGDFSKTWQYFLDHEKELKGREGGKWKNRKDWYAFGRKQNLHRFEQKKILVQVLANRNSFTLDEDEIYYFMGAGGSNAYGILLNDEYNTADDYLYFLGLLNSSILEFYIKHISPLYSGRYYIYDRQYLEKLPIKLFKTPEEEDIAFKVVSTVERILKQHKELRKLEDKISEFPDSYVKGSLQPLSHVMESRDLTKESYSPSRLRIEVEDIEGKTIYKVALMKKDYIAFKVESSAKFLLEVLKRKGRIIKNDLLKMEVPSDADAERIMREYKGDLEKMEGLKREIADLDKNIDERVYELYGLDAGDRRVIENWISGR